MSTSHNHDSVNHPSHYTQGSIECIDAIEAALSYEEFQGFLKGQILKYTWRAKYKGANIEDLKKCEWYLNRCLSFLCRTQFPEPLAISILGSDEGPFLINDPEYIIQYLPILPSIMKIDLEDSKWRGPGWYVLCLDEFSENFIVGTPCETYKEAKNNLKLLLDKSAPSAIV